MVNVCTFVTVSSAVERREEASTYYRGQEVRKGSRDPITFYMCLSFAVVSLFVDCKN